jgi:uncharacterized membrane protein
MLRVIEQARELRKALDDAKECENVLKERVRKLEIEVDEWRSMMRTGERPR